MSTTNVTPIPSPSSSLVVRFAERFGVEPGKLLETLRATVFKADPPATNEQMMTLLLVAEEYGLNPFVKQLHAFTDRNGGVVPFISIDGWIKLTNQHAQYDGCEFRFEDTPDGGSMTCTMHRKDRAHPIVVVEFMSECKRNSGAWQTAPRRMLRHRAYIQAARLAFGFGGIFDESEARDVVEMGAAEVVERPRKGTAGLKAAMRKMEPAAVDVNPTPKEPEDPAAVDAKFDRIAAGIRQAIDRKDAEEWLVIAADELPEEYHREMVMIFAECWETDSSNGETDDPA